MWLGFCFFFVWFELGDEGVTAVQTFFFCGANPWACREDAGFTKPKNSFMDGCTPAAGSSSSKARKERIRKRDAQRARKERLKRWLPSFLRGDEPQ